MDKFAQLEPTELIDFESVIFHPLLRRTLTTESATQSERQEWLYRVRDLHQNRKNGENAVLEVIHLGDVVVAVN